MFKVDNAIIMAAGTSSRFAPLSYEKPKSLITVRGEVLIERQIRQLKEAGITDIYIVTGYKSEQFAYLKEKFGVRLLHNPDYLTRNNNASIHVARNVIGNSYICSSDNYFSVNPFTSEVAQSYYAALYAEGRTKEWCLTSDKDGIITDVTVGGCDSYYMMGHTFWDENFSRDFLHILENVYDAPETADMLWEDLYIRHLDVLKMQIRPYASEAIYEFDTLDELRQFDSSYVEHTHSRIMESLSRHFDARESAFTEITAYKDASNAAAGFTFHLGDKHYRYCYASAQTSLICPAHT